MKCFNFEFFLFDSLRPINNLSVIYGWIFLGRTSTKQICLAQGPQYSDAGEARTRGPSVLNHSTTEPLHSLEVL